MDNCPAVSHTVLALSSQWMSFPSRVWRRGVSPRFHLIVLCLVWIKRIRRQGEFKILLCNTNGGNLLHRQSLIWNPVKHKRWSKNKTPPQTSDRTPSADLVGGVVNVECGWTASVWNSWPQVGVQESAWSSIKLWEIRSLTFGDLGSPKWARPRSCISRTCLGKEERRDSVIWYVWSAFRWLG